MPKFFGKTRVRAPEVSGERLGRLFGFSGKPATGRVKGGRASERLRPPRAKLNARDMVLNDDIFRTIVQNPDMKHLYFDMTPDAIEWRRANYNEVNAMFRELNPNADKMEAAVREAVEHEVRNAYRQYRRTANDPTAYSDERMAKDIEDIIRNTDISYTFFNKDGYPQVFVNEGGQYAVTPDFSTAGWEGAVDVNAGFNGLDGPTIFANNVTDRRSFMATVAHEANHAVQLRNMIGRNRSISDGETAAALDRFKAMSGKARNGRNAHPDSYHDDEIMASVEEARLMLDHYFPNGIPDEAILNVRINPDGTVSYSSVLDVLKGHGVTSGYIRDDFVPDLEASIVELKDDPQKLSGFVSGWRRMFRTLYNNLPLIGGVAVGAGALAGLMRGGGSLDSHLGIYRKYFSK